MPETSVSQRRESRDEARPIDRFGVLDSAPVRVVHLASASASDIANATGASAVAVRKLVSARRARQLRSFDDLAGLGLGKRDLDRLRR